ncbi:hypothetical protein BI375_02085 [Vibrio rotiferianus]|uniref:Uncharacterized protein n=1 Tax=Vibrio rotiferianus TaxID=190895 RepID=A0ABX3DDX5_9VIBR|nr:hypothetical protein [Vibrio rotiferianus]OHY96324.1 hypothetical protein BI375_02085 [Vibrio rotiferianus]
MDNSAALLLKCCDHIEQQLVRFGTDSYLILQSGSRELIKKFEVFDSVLSRAREYIFLGLFVQARRLISIMQLLCELILSDSKSLSS